MRQQGLRNLGDSRGGTIKSYKNCNRAITEKAWGEQKSGQRRYRTLMAPCGSIRKSPWLFFTKETDIRTFLGFEELGQKILIDIHQSNFVKHPQHKDQTRNTKL